MSNFISIAVTLGLALLFICQPSIVNSQKKIDPVKKLSVFDNFISKKWKAEGNWGDGSLFKQEISFDKKLDGHLIIVESHGYVNKEKTEWGPRNFGIRKWDPELNEIVFTEHDVFGGTTQGTVTTNSNGDIIYTYNYEGIKLTDYWQKISSSKYKFTVGIYEAEKFNQIFLETYMTSSN